MKIMGAGGMEILNGPQEGSRVGMTRGTLTHVNYTTTLAVTHSLPHYLPPAPLPPHL